MLNSVSTFCTDNIMCVCRSVVWVSSDSLHHHNHEDSVKAILFFVSVPFMFFYNLYNNIDFKYIFVS